MSIDGIISEFKKYILSSYIDICYLQHIKNMLIESVDMQDFLSQFQGEKFAMLLSYFLLVHNNIILEICKIIDQVKYSDDYTLIKFLQQFSKTTCYDVKEDEEIIKDIYEKYKNVRNKKIAHFTVVNFTKNSYKKKNGNIIKDTKHNDIFSFNELDEDIFKIGNVIQKYANLLDVKIETIQETQKNKYINFPKITPDFIRKQELFSPLF